MLVQPDHDEDARQEICRALRAHLLTEVQPGTRTVFEKRVAPEYFRKHNRHLDNRHDVREWMSADPFYRLYCVSLRSTQELLWDSVIDSVEREMPRLRSQLPEAESPTLGSLTLDPSVETPDYHAAADIHLQPGGYHTELGNDDVAAGAIYDRAVFIYGDGRYGAYNELMGSTVCDVVEAIRPGLRPRRILEIGCTVGNSILPYADHYPDAELHGIDVGSACLRYAHGRAESLEKAVHFAQANAEKTRFEDGHFDLIVSHLLFHETGKSAFRNILRECYRLLAPGGLMAHLDIPQDMHCDDLYDSFLWDWEAYNNNETFEVVLRDLDYEKEAETAGFARPDIRLETAPFGWPVLISEKPGTDQ
jgi:SAM-dependent methyltransferase